VPTEQVAGVLQRFSGVREIEVAGLACHRQKLVCKSRDEALTSVTFARVGAATAWADVRSDARCRSLTIKFIPSPRLW
jgi:hypothetical protein